MKQLKLILFFLCLFIMGLVVSVNAQKRVITKATIDERGLISVQFKEGNEEWGYDYLTKEEFNKAFQDQFEGETYTDRQGTRYPVFISVNKKKFCIRTSATGNTYRFYIKPKTN